jgi:hypothetical protein
LTLLTLKIWLKTIRNTSFNCVFTASWLVLQLLKPRTVITFPMMVECSQELESTDTEALLSRMKT